MAIIGFCCATSDAILGHFGLGIYMSASINSFMCFVLMAKLTDADLFPDCGLIIAVSQSILILFQTTMLTVMFAPGDDEDSGLYSGPTDSPFDPEELDDGPAAQAAALQKTYVETLAEMQEPPPASAPLPDGPGKAVPVVNDRPKPKALSPRSPAEPQRLDEPVLQDTPLRGPHFSTRLTAPSGWKLDDSPNQEHRLFHPDGIAFAVTVLQGEADNQQFARDEAQVFLADRPGLLLTSQQAVEIDGRPWGRFDFRDETGGRVFLLFTHAGRQGRYRIEVEGSREALEHHSADLSKMIASFRLAPDNVDMRLPQDRVVVTGP